MSAMLTHPAPPRLRSDVMSNRGGFISGQRSDPADLVVIGSVLEGFPPMRHMAMVIGFGLAIAMLVGAVQFSDLGRFGESVDHMVPARLAR